MGKSDGRSGQIAYNTPALRVVVYYLSPATGHTPWWGRLARRLKFTHMAFSIGGMVWDQPIRGAGKCSPWMEWYLSKMEGVERAFAVTTIDVMTHDPERLILAFRRIEHQKGQPIRTALRYLRLWPRPAWNCTSPVRLVLNALDIEVTGETPDGIRQQLVSKPTGFSTNLAAALHKAAGVG